jgi:hypothetical protein
MIGDHNQSDPGWRKRQIALDKKAENARELGLDYEPVAIPDCGEAGHADGACGNRECLPSFRRNTTLPAAPVQEPVAWPIETNNQLEVLAKQCGWDNRRYMTPADYQIWCDRMRQFVQLASTPAQPALVQKPYGYWWIPDGSVSGLKPEMSPNTGPHPNFTVIPLYTAPPAQPAPVQERNFCERCGKRIGDYIHTCTPPAAQRTWVDLTDEEITDIWYETAPYYHQDDFARAIEAKLKEKNT